MRRSLSGYREVHAVRIYMHNDWIQIRSCMLMHKSETDWMHARGQPASARAWPAASGQLAGWPVASARVLRYQIGIWRARIHGAPCPLHLRAPNTYLVPWIYDLNFDFWGTHYRHDKPPIEALGIYIQ